MASISFCSLSPELHLHIGGFLALHDLGNLAQTSAYFRLLLKDPLTIETPKLYWRKQLRLFQKFYRKCDEIYAIRTLSLLLHDILRDWGYPAKLSAWEKKQEFHMGKPLPKWMHWPIVRTGHMFTIIDRIFAEDYTNNRLPLLEYIDCEKLVERLGVDYARLDQLRRFTKTDLSIPNSSNTSLERTAFVYKLLFLYFALTELSPARAAPLILCAVNSRSEELKTDVESALIELYSMVSLFLELYEVSARTESKNTNYCFLTASAARILRTRMEEYTAFYFAASYKSGMAESGLTAEQAAVVETDLQPGDLVKVQAYAGTGKTRCLRAYAESRPNTRFLYVAYNKAMQREAEEAFPRNVHCRTIHSLAYRDIYLYASDLYNNQMTLKNLSPSDIIHALELDFGKCHAGYATCADRSRSTPWPTANRVLETINRFCHSQSRELTDEHVPTIPDGLADSLVLKKYVFVGWARKCWAKMMKAEMPIGHDVYLKLLQLSGDPAGERCVADSHIFENYDCILFDEAQDATPASAEIILRQRPYVGILLVGDPYQMIYQFKGANNCAFDEELYPSSRKFYLTESFRFGNKIARMANTILQKFNEPVPVSGVRDGDDEIRCRYVFREFGPTKDDPFEPAPRKQFTCLFRKNKTLLAKLIQLKAQFPKRKIFLLTAPDYSPEKLLDLLQQAHNLAVHSTPCTHPALKRFSSWHALYSAREKLHEQEFDFPHVLDLVCSASGFIQSPSFKEQLQRMRETFVSREEDADVILATCHQAKGREWDDVEVSDDFCDVNNLDCDQAKEEWNMLYVAVTRARKRLLISQFSAELYTNSFGRSRYYLTNKVPYATSAHTLVYMTRRNGTATGTVFQLCLQKELEMVKYNLSCAHANSKDGLMVEEELVLPYGSYVFKETAWQKCFDSCFSKKIQHYCVQCMEAKLTARPDIYIPIHMIPTGYSHRSITPHAHLQGRILDTIYANIYRKKKDDLDFGSETRYLYRNFDEVMETENNITCEYQVTLSRFKISSEMDRFNPLVPVNCHFHWNCRRRDIKEALKTAYTTLLHEPHDTSDYNGVPDVNYDSDEEDDEDDDDDHDPESVLQNFISNSLAYDDDYDPDIELEGQPFDPYDSYDNHSDEHSSDYGDDGFLDEMSPSEYLNWFCLPNVSAADVVLHGPQLQPSHTLGGVQNPSFFTGNSDGWETGSNSGTSDSSSTFVSTNEEEDDYHGDFPTPSDDEDDEGGDFHEGGFSGGSAASETNDGYDDDLEEEDVVHNTAATIANALEHQIQTSGFTGNQLQYFQLALQNIQDSLHYGNH